MTDDFKIKIKNVFGGFIIKNRLKQIDYRYDEEVFGNGVIEFIGPKKIHLRIIKDRSQWFVEMKRDHEYMNTWFDFFDFLIYKNEDVSSTKELIYSGEMNEDEQLLKISPLVEKNYEKIAELLKDEVKAKPFFEYFQKPIQFT